MREKEKKLFESFGAVFYIDTGGRVCQNSIEKVCCDR